MALLWGAAGCKDTFTDARLPACSSAVGGTQTLAVGQYVVVNAEANSGCVIFPANASGTEREYLLVAQAATPVAGAVITYWLEGGLGGPVPAPPASAPLVSADLSPAERFHLELRELEAGRFAALPPAPSGGPATAAPVPPLPQRAKPVVGELRSFQVLANINTGRFDRVTARARAVGAGLAIFVDTTAPANGLNDADLDTLTAVFDARLYAVDTAAFGRESDINQDSVVVVLMTPVVNRLVSTAECLSGEGYIVGFFVGADIDPLFAGDVRSNRGEVFYSFVPDSAGTVSCVHSRDQVKRAVPVAFVHEFQHMISYNQHVLVRGREPEVLWLNEALSHYAEELGGRTYLAEGDNAKFTQYVVSDLYNAARFFNNPGAYFTLPRTGIGGLAERGASWLFLRYLIDQYSGGTTVAEWNAFTRRMVATTNTGAANVQTLIPVPFSQALMQWGLANWVDELPGFTAPPELRYPSWDLRNIFQQLNASRPADFPDVFPLEPPMGPASEVERIGMLRAGTPIYQRAVQPAGGAGFTMRFGTGYATVFPISALVKLGIVRIR